MTLKSYFRIALMLFGWSVAHSQEPACGLHSLVETIAPTYLPMGKAAHVSGDVMLMATFEHGGTVSEVHVIRGPMMLQSSAVEFVKDGKPILMAGAAAAPSRSGMFLSTSVAVIATQITHYRMALKANESTHSTTS